MKLHRRKAFRKVSKQESSAIELRHSKINSEYLVDGKKLLQQRDYLQASEKYWGAAVQMIKVIAARRGFQLESHRSIADFVSKLDQEHPELNLSTLYAMANSLHVNFYEDNVPPEMVKQYSDAVEEFVEKLRLIK